MDSKDNFRVDERVEISVDDGVCSVIGPFEVSFPIASARFVWVEADTLALFGWGALRIEVGEEPRTTLALRMSGDQARQLQLFLERSSQGVPLH